MGFVNRDCPDDSSSQYEGTLSTRSTQWFPLLSLCLASSTPVGHSPEKTRSMPLRQCRILVPGFPYRAPGLASATRGRNLLSLRCGDQAKFIPSSPAELPVFES